MRVWSRRRKKGKLKFWCFYLSLSCPSLEDRSSLVDAVASCRMLLLPDQSIGRSCCRWMLLPLEVVLGLDRSFYWKIEVFQ